MTQFTCSSTTPTTSTATASISNLNLSSKNFSEELANLASLTSNSNDNTLDNPASYSTAAASTSAENNATISISCDNNDPLNTPVDLNGPSSVDSAVGGTLECNGSLSNNQNDLQNSSSVIGHATETLGHLPASSSASSTSSGNFSTSPSQQNVFESTAFSQSYLCTLLANIENEISITQQHLDDENDKRHKYKVMYLIHTHLMTLNTQL